MFHLMKIEWRKIRLSTLFALVAITIVACVLTCTLYPNYALRYDLDAWEVGTEFFGLIYPLFVVIPLCWGLYYERKNNFLIYVRPRVSLKMYLFTKWLVYALSGFLIITIPYLMSAVAALYIKPPIVPFDPGSGPVSPFAHVFLDAYTQHPMAYAVGLSCWKGVIGILIMTMGFVLAMYCDNIFVVLTGPFMYAVLENFILSILSVPQYRLVTAFEPSCIAPDAVSAASFIAGPTLELLVTLFLVLFFKKIRKVKVVQI